jgi:NADP-dependent 3-hydroxy acid dehydrogenase YdfG
LTSHYLAQPNSLVIAAVRDPTSASSAALAKLPKHDSSDLITVKIDAVPDTDAHDAVAQLQSDYNVAKLDVVIANAGYGTVYGDLAAVQADEVKKLFDINALGRCFSPFASVFSRIPKLYAHERHSFNFRIKARLGFVPTPMFHNADLRHRTPETLPSDKRAAAGK